MNLKYLAVSAVVASCLAGSFPVLTAASSSTESLTEEALGIFKKHQGAKSASAPLKSKSGSKSKGKSKEEPERAARDTTSAYEKYFKGESARTKGLFTLHLQKGKLLVEIPDSVLGKDFILGSTIKQVSDNAVGIVGSKDDLIHFTLTKIDSLILWRSIDDSYYSMDTNVIRSLSDSHISTIVFSLPIKKKFNGGKSYVVDATDIFLANANINSMRAFTGRDSGSEGNSYKKDLSYISGIKAFSDNVSITSVMSYSHSENRNGVKSSKPLTVVLTRSILRLPDEVYHPRLADSRIGYFKTGKELVGEQTSPTLRRYYINRWRLEPSDTAAYLRGELVEPKKPIVYYVDSNFPEWWKPYIRAAIEDWNDVFERIGFKNAIVAKDFPENDPEFDPDNIKYSCVRFAPIAVENAMGPSWVDPRSGEIINASVYVYSDLVNLLSNWLFVQTAASDERVRKASIPKELVGASLLYAIRHEVGHTLGLMHNMIASYTIPVDSLRSPSFTRKYGTTRSIMDYARNNYVAQRGDAERGVNLNPPKFGSYDFWAIRWGYTPVFGAKNFDEETSITRQWITDSLKVAPWYQYGAQQSVRSFYDPRRQTEDLGDDALKASDYGFKNLRYITENFMDWISDEDDPDYSRRMDLYKNIINQFARYLGHLANNVGGLYSNEVLVTDTIPQYQNVPGSYQREVMEYLGALYENLDWIDNEKALAKLPVVGRPSGTLRERIESLILSSPYACALTDGVASKEYSFGQCMDDVFDIVWKPTRSGKKLTDDQKRFQTSLIENLMNRGGFAMPSSGKSDSFADPENVCGDGRPSAEAFWLGDESQVDFEGWPVSGFGSARTSFAVSQVTQGQIYYYLQKAEKLLKSRMASASPDDRAHYEILVKTIEYGTK